MRREGGLAIAVTAVGALALGAVAVGALAIGKTAIVAMRGSPLSSELRKAQPPCREHRGTESVHHNIILGWSVIPSSAAAHPFHLILRLSAC